MGWEKPPAAPCLPKYVLVPTSAAMALTCEAMPPIGGRYWWSSSGPPPRLPGWRTTVRRSHLTSMSKVAVRTAALLLVAVGEGDQLSQRTLSAEVACTYDRAGRVAALPPDERAWTFTGGNAGNAAYSPIPVTSLLLSSRACAYSVPQQRTLRLPHRHWSLPSPHGDIMASRGRYLAFQGLTRRVHGKRGASAQPWKIRRGSVK